ncbi:MAG: glycoside hydrolase family 1 protein [Candidatus Promineofilum sp.]|nr:glycoside hydrolase family 1 protein [Promineifilum sp.]
MDNNVNFLWAVGIENTFIPDEKHGLRALEEYELTQHYSLWREDIDRAASLGVSAIRWGIPWYRVNPRPGEYDWAWVDEVLDYTAVQKGIQPIIDLMHYGTPLWLENAFLHPDYPRLVADYAHEVARRYGDLVRYYTPLNEPGVNADFAGRRGEWPPYSKGDSGYVATLLPIVRGMTLTAEAIRAADPDAVLVQVEALGWLWTQDAKMQPTVDNLMAHTFLPFDLFSGRVDENHPLWPFLLDNGAAETDLAWLREHPSTVDVLGVNLYPWSGGRSVSWTSRLIGELSGHHLGDLLRYVWNRYRLPMMVTETSARRDVAGRSIWMDETIASVAAVRAEGVPVVGYTWFPMMTMIDWEYRSGHGPVEEYLLHLGLWDSAYDAAGVLQRHETPLVARYSTFVAQGAPTVRLPTPPFPSGS